MGTYDDSNKVDNPERDERPGYDFGDQTRPGPRAADREFAKRDGGRSEPKSPPRDEFRRSILNHHTGSAQRSALVVVALDAIFAGLDELARYGHVLEVREVETSGSGDEWPKMLYHADEPGGRVFHEFNVPSAGGWSDSPVVQADRPEQDRPEPDYQGGQTPSVKPGGFPKKLYHEHVPGGVVVQTAEQESEFKGRGWLDTAPDRGDVNYGSGAARIEDRDPEALGENNDDAAQRVPLKRAGDDTRVEDQTNGA